jgi:hypothetical protein
MNNLRTLGGKRRTEINVKLEKFEDLIVGALFLSLPSRESRGGHKTILFLKKEDI